MQNNKVNQENEKPKSLLKKFADWIDEREQRAGRLPVSPMIGLVFVEMVGVGLYVMLAMCSWQTMLIISGSTVIGLIVLYCIAELVRKIFFRKKTQITKSLTLDSNLNNNRDSKEDFIIQANNSNSLTVKTVKVENKTVGINSGNNIINNKEDL